RSHQNAVKARVELSYNSLLVGGHRYDDRTSIEIVQLAPSSITTTLQLLRQRVKGFLAVKKYVLPGRAIRFQSFPNIALSISQQRLNSAVRLPYTFRLGHREAPQLEH